MDNKKQLIVNLSAIYLSIFLSSVSFGIISVLIAVKMDKFVGNETLISLAAAMQIFAAIFFAKYLPIVSKKLGILKTIQISTFCAAVMALVLYQYFGYFIWLFTIFIFGTSLFAFSIITMLFLYLTLNIRSYWKSIVSKSHNKIFLRHNFKQPIL